MKLACDQNYLLGGLREPKLNSSLLRFEVVLAIEVRFCLQNICIFRYAQGPKTQRQLDAIGGVLEIKFDGSWEPCIFGHVLET